MAFGIGDFFGNVFTKIGTDFLKKGFKGVIEKPIQQKQRQQIVPPSFSGVSMGMYSPSPTRQAEPIEVSDYEVTLAMWNRRLFGDDSYTNITIPRID